jgi:hypothetical protein
MSEILALENWVFTSDFIEKLILLAVAAVVTGLGVPWVLKRAEEKKLREGKIIEAQSQLLDDLSRILWKWRYLAKKVTYYASEANSEKFEIARKEYDEDVWDLLNELRVQASRSRRLASEKAYRKLLDFYAYVVHDVDLQISALAKRDELDPATLEQATLLSQRFTNEVSNNIDEIIDELASELHLKATRPAN